MIVHTHAKNSSLTSTGKMDTTDVWDNKIKTLILQNTQITMHVVIKVLIIITGVFNVSLPVVLNWTVIPQLFMGFQQQNVNTWINVSAPGMDYIGALLKGFLFCCMAYICESIFTTRQWMYAYIV